MSEETHSPISAEKMTGPSKLWIGIAIPLVLLVNALDLFVPPAGVPLAILLIWWILRRTGSRWAYLGLSRPASWKRTIALGLGLGVALQAAAMFGLEPLLRSLSGEEIDLSRFESLRGNWGSLALYLTISWTTAGFGEEIIWRGWVMTGVAKLLGSGKAGWVSALIATSVLFGILHLYQGPTGVIATGIVGLALGIIYLATGRNLWVTIICHGMMDTIAFVMLFLGVEM